MDPWLETGCWRDVPDDQEGVRTCEADPHPESALGLCGEHERQLAMSASSRFGDRQTCRDRAAARSLANEVGPVQDQDIRAHPRPTSEMCF
jgi:hypothetical protein